MDPFTYFSFYANVKYIITGKNTSIPMIPIKGFRYLPSFKFGLSPFGPETYFENYICNEKGPFYVYFKRGKHWENRYFGAGFQAPYIYSPISNLFFGLKLDFWKQPVFLGPSKALQNIDHFIFFDFKEADLKKERFGASLSFIASYHLTKIPFFFDGTVGYKTKGFVPGESLKRSPIFKIGLGGDF